MFDHAITAVSENIPDPFSMGDPVDGLQDRLFGSPFEVEALQVFFGEKSCLLGLH